MICMVSMRFPRFLPWSLIERWHLATPLIPFFEMTVKNSQSASNTLHRYLDERLVDIHPCPFTAVCLRFPSCGRRFFGVWCTSDDDLSQEVKVGE